MAFIMTLLIFGFFSFTKCQIYCDPPKAHNPCASPCSSTCTNPSPICAAVCDPRCVCPSELVERSSNDATCVLPSTCPGVGCPNNGSVFNCLVAPCANSICPGIPSAICLDDYCNGCKARHFFKGEEVTEKCRGTMTTGTNLLLIVLNIIVYCILF